MQIHSVQTIHRIQTQPTKMIRVKVVQNQSLRQKNIDPVRKFIEEDRHVTYHDIKAFLSIRNTSVHKILLEHSKERKLYARWIQHLLVGA